MTLSSQRDSLPDLASFLSLLNREDKVLTINAEVDARLEVAEIHRRVVAEGGPALLFRNVKGSGWPLVTNLFGTERRVELAFGKQGYEFIRRLVDLIKHDMPPTLATLWQNRGLIRRGVKIGLRSIKNPPVAEEVISPARISELPSLTTWSQDGGPFFTLPLVYTEHPETHGPNLGMYRMQVYDAQTTGLHMQIGKGGGFHLKVAEQLGQRLPVNVFLGGPPAAIVGAIAPLPENVPELLLSSLLLGKKVRMSTTKYSKLPVLADAEFAFIGESDPLERRPEGPFGDHYGYYSLTHDFPVFRCRTMLAKKNAIFPATVVGKPRQEDFYIGDFLQELLSPLFPVVMPNVSDLWSYGETGFHSLASAVIKERYRREAMVAAFRILGEGQLSLTKFLLLIDKPMDLRDFKTVLSYALERADFRTDLYVFSNLSMDTLDYTGPSLNEGSKGVLLGMGEPIRELPAEFSGDLPRGASEAAVFCPGCIVVSGPSYSDAPTFPSVLANAKDLSSWPLVILADDASKTASSDSNFLWSVFTRFEPASDIYARNTELHRYHPMLESPIVIDSRMKPDYPEELECDDDTKKLVDRRWTEYFPN